MVRIDGSIQDEIEHFENMRCIGSLEASARLFSLPQSERHPAVQQLTVHLEGCQVVLFPEGGERVALESANVKTELTEFFTFNKLHPATQSSTVIFQNSSTGISRKNNGSGGN